MELNKTNEKKIVSNPETIETVTKHYQQQLEEEKKKHQEEIQKLKTELENEKKRHIQDIRDILTAGKIQIPENENKTISEEEALTEKLRSKFNLK